MIRASPPKKHLEKYIYFNINLNIIFFFICYANSQGLGNYKL